MRILIVHHYCLAPGEAGGSRWNQFARYWAQAGHEVTVLSGSVHYATGLKEPKYKGRLVVREKPYPGVTVYRCHVSESYNRSFAGRLWAYLSFTFSSTLVALLRAPKADVIVAISPPLTVGLTMAVLSAITGTRCVFEVRDLWPESAIDTGVLASRPLIWLSYRLEELSYRRASLINVLTPAFEKVLIQNKGVSAKRIRMIPNGADLDILHPDTKENRVRRLLSLEGKFVVAYFGAHGRANRVGQLLDAAEMLKDRDDIRFMLVGDGMEKPQLLADAKSRKLNNVVFVDAVSKDQIGKYINAADVCTAVLMKNDTFKTVYPNKVFDYMSCSRPVIIAIDGVARELIETAEAGLYVEPENPHDMVDAILRIKNNPRLADTMAENGFAYVSEHFDRRKLAQGYLKQLESLVSKSADSPSRRTSSKKVGK